MAATFQIEFIQFPGIEPYAVEPWPHLPLPWRRVNENAEIDDISDAAIALVDWAIDDHPEVFGLDAAGGNYEGANDLAVSLAGEIALAMDGKKRIASDGGLWADWYQDVDLATGVTVRVALFTNGGGR